MQLHDSLVREATITHALNRYRCRKHTDPLSCHVRRNPGRRALPQDGMSAESKRRISRLQSYLYTKKDSIISWRVDSSFQKSRHTTPHSHTSYFPNTFLASANSLSRTPFRPCRTRISHSKFFGVLTIPSMNPVSGSISIGFPGFSLNSKAQSNFTMEMKRLRSAR